MKERKTFPSTKSTNVQFVSPHRVHAVGGASANEFRFSPGEGLPWHSHDEPHLTICMAGSCVVRIDGQADVIMTPADPSVVLQPHIEHEIEALEPGTVILNIYP